MTVYMYLVKAPADWLCIHVWLGMAMGDCSLIFTVQVALLASSLASSKTIIKMLFDIVECS